MKPPQSVCFFKNLLSSFYCTGQLHNSHLSSVAKKMSCVMRLHSCGFWRPDSLLDTARFSLAFHGWLRKKHQDSRALWKHEAVQKYLETLSKEYQQVNSLLNADSKNEFEQRTLRRRSADLSPVATAFQEIKEAEGELRELETMCRGKECTSTYSF